MYVTTSFFHGASSRAIAKMSSKDQIIDSPEQRPELEAPRPEDQLNLLSDEEHESLEAFFTRMANDPVLDPNLFVDGAGQGNDNNQDAFSQFGSGGEFDFQNSMPQQFQTSSTRSSEAKPQVSAGPGNASASALAYGVGPQNQPHMSSQHGREPPDVVSAAQHLTGMGYAGQQGPPTPTQYVQANMNSRQQYPPISQTFTNQPYQTSNGQHSRSNSGYTNTTPLTHTPTFEQSRATQKHPIGLAFGSDDKFQPNEYKSLDEHAQYQEDLHQLHFLNSAVTEGPHDHKLPPSQYGGNMSPTSGHVGGHQSNASYDGDDDHPDNPRKRTRRDADLDDGANAPSASRRKSTGTANKRGPQKQAASPNRRKSSAAAGGATGTSPPGSSNGGTAPKSARQNLSEDQKRENHIQSEQKRRNLIKEGFDECKTMVPELRNVNPTKGAFLQTAAKFMRDLKERNAEMARLIEEMDKG